jgi:LmbE family N-acetylglucosaminyl deacetylase
MPVQDTGAVGAWQKILKARTTASVMHTTAHPDDEHGGVITRLARKDGARLALMTLNRGESGDNAIGSQLFDGLGLIRTEELRISDRYYGVDEQYFTTVVDYGFSKRLEEAFEKWGKDQVMRDVVRIIRMSRPWVLLSRFQGNQRDGHGNHQTAGLITQLAFKAAGDPNVYPEQIEEGLRPWQPFKVYMGGVRENEPWTVRIDSGEYSPYLGDSFDNVARFGLSFQRSQNSGRFNPARRELRLLLHACGHARRSAPEKESSVFDGLNTSYSGLFSTLGRRSPEGVGDQLARGRRLWPRHRRLHDDRSVGRRAVAGRRAAVHPRGDRRKSAGEDEALFILRIKERQTGEAITGVPRSSSATQPAGRLAEPTGRRGVRGTALDGGAGARPDLQCARLANRGRRPSGAGRGDDGDGDRLDGVGLRASGIAESVAPHDVLARRFTVAVAPAHQHEAVLPPERPAGEPLHARRPGAVRPRRLGPATRGRGPLRGRGLAGDDARGGEAPRGQAAVRRRAPRGAQRAAPWCHSVARGRRDSAGEHEQARGAHGGRRAQRGGATTGAVTLTVPQGWTVTPREQAFTFARAGERASYRFTVAAASIDARPYRVEAVATAAGQSYREGYEVIDQRDLEVRYLYRPSTVEVRGIDVTVLSNLKVGYVMGVGDQVPQGLTQLGAQVTLLGERELASSDLSQFDAVMTGTRAYAVREDLKTYNTRLLDYVKAGGNMIVLYNTAELVPNRYAPFPADNPRNSEEVSEEDSPVEILAPAHQAFTWPNRITAADFNGWMEQRGSKFFSTWDKAARR